MMNSYAVTEFGKPLQQLLREAPAPMGDEVLVRVQRSGLCHSDLHLWEGYFELGGGKRMYVKDRGVNLPVVPGHEPYGTVTALGSEAAARALIRADAPYIVYPWIGCGQCDLCARGFDNHCMKHRYIGVLAPGAFSTHLLVPHSRYLVPAGGIDPSFAATLACSGLTAYSGVRKLGLWAADQPVLVLGCGGLGMMALAMLKALGHTGAIACDVDDGKLAAAGALGARATVNLGRPDAAERVREYSAGKLAAAIDYVGTQGTAEFALAALVKGGQLVVCGLFGGEIGVSLAPLVQRAITLRGSYVGTLQELHEVVELARTGAIPTPPIETRSVDRLNGSLAEMKAGRLLGRVVFDFDVSAPASTA